jgi:hypothetical protein
MCACGNNKWIFFTIFTIFMPFANVWFIAHILEKKTFMMARTNAKKNIWYIYMDKVSKNLSLKINKFSF